MGKAKGIRYLSLLLPVVLLASCSTAAPKKDAPPETTEEAQAAPTAPVAPAPTAPVAPARAEPAELQELVKTLSSRLESAEAKIAALTDRLASAQQGPEKGSEKGSEKPMEKPVEKPKLSAVPKHPSEDAGSRVDPLPYDGDPESGFANDEPVQDYRRAMILFRAAKYPESVLAFSSFLEKFPDHPLAGSAQFYVGQSYALQKEYKLALQEFERVLTSYDRSPHIAQTLREMAEAEDKLRMTEEAARHRQLLMSLFPHSPYAVRTTAARSSDQPAADVHREATPPTVPLDPVPATETHSAIETPGKPPKGETEQ